MSLPAASRLLTSAAFRRARWRAGATASSGEALERLLREVEAKRQLQPILAFGSYALDLDIICAVAEAHLETLHDPPVWPACPEDPTSITGRARLRLVIAALHYLVDPDDVIPDSQPHGVSDDIVVLRWASRMARGELPAA